MTPMRKKNAAMAKHTLYTARYPTSLSHVSCPILPHKWGTELSFIRIPGDNMQHDAMNPINNMNVYPIREAVEFLQEGHALQHRLQAAEPQQHAS